MKLNKKQKKGLRKFIIIEYVVMLIVIVICSNIRLKRENDKLQTLVESQQIAINTLADKVNTNTTNNYYTTQVKQLAYNITSEEKELLAKLLYCEGRGENVDCQRAIVSVVLNRLDSGKWGNTLSSVIYAKNQFEPVAMGLLKSATPTETQYNAIDYVLANGATVPNWVLYFRAGHHFNWTGYTQYLQLSNTYFGGYMK